MKITTYSVTLRGIRPLLMHNGRLANPRDEHAKNLKSLTKKTNKSDDDYEDCSKAEFMGSLYYDNDLGPILPVDNLQAMVVEGARKRKLGKQMEALVEVVEPEKCAGYKLVYQGPRDPEGLYADDAFVFIKQARVGQSRVMRTRPRFPKWEVTFQIEVMEGGPDEEQVREALQDAGLFVGLGDWSPRYGRFELAAFERISGDAPEAKQARTRRKAA